MHSFILVVKMSLAVSISRISSFVDHTAIKIESVLTMNYQLIVISVVCMIVVNGNEEKPLAYIGAASTLSCLTKNSPIWSWYGKDSPIATNLAAGDRKHTRFQNQR